MRKVASLLGVAAVLLGAAAVCGVFPLAPFFLGELGERASGATGLLLAAGLFTIAIAAVVRK